MNTLANDFDDASKYTILVVDDEKRMVRFIKLNLKQDGFRVLAAYNGSDALEEVRTQLPDLILLDVMMPDINGFEVLRKIREVNTVPVIMLTAKGEEEDRIRGLELGADDYVTKPFSPQELVSRVKAVLRRTKAFQEEQIDVIEVDSRLKIDFSRREVWVEGKKVELRPTEYRLLYHLVKNAGWVSSHEKLLTQVWGFEYRDEPHYVRLYVNYLRKKLEENPSNPKYIITERGVGYRFVDFRHEREETQK
ncbi:MAG: response regulator transcription factor [Chloroflexota bacterium]|nr:response regulator transcription factor [Chloroflexota bacterium]